MNSLLLNKSEKNKIQPLELIARIGVFGTFLGHGITAYGINPKWIPLLMAFGFSGEQAVSIMPYIGVLDIIVAIVILIYPIRIVLFWALFWTFLTALSRPISGDSILELFERSSNWVLPLVLILIKYHPKNKIK
ncbi:MAG: hypothetical protein PHC28_05220 [Flavobacterium sp.]|uniref:hypothetical protein n=1 Tax=Flavobacterium sp. TaxID=239 RepID=UPI00262D084A|nr:hypothetical protein [Flavobacterium sp.]MDD5149867.1 hypothetical protein [Flavobacterium sp.]